MRNLLFLLLMVGNLHANDFIKDSIEIAGQIRHYVYKYPDSYHAIDKIPVVIALHGGGSNWKKFNRGTTKYSLEKAANKNKVLLIYPQGINNHWNDGRDKNNQTNDVAFISALIDKAINQYHVDTTKVFVTGMSNGGFMTIRIAQELSRKVTAVAAIAAQIGVNNRGLNIEESVSFLLINGTQDPIVPYFGGEMKPFKFAKSRGFVLSTQQTIGVFVNHNQCQSKPKIAVKNTRKFDNTIAIIKKYKDCTKQSQVELIEIEGGGHTWPGGKQYLPKAIIGNLSREINASELIVDFFLNVN